MIDTCHAAGVGVIADAVINHMAGVESGESLRSGVQPPLLTTILQGSAWVDRVSHMALEMGIVIDLLIGFTHYDYPGIYQFQDFHHCGLTPNDGIENFGDRQQVQTCQLVGLAEYALGPLVDEMS